MKLQLPSVSQRELYVLAACACFAVAAMLEARRARELESALAAQNTWHAYQRGYASGQMAQFASVRVESKKPCGCHGAAKSEATPAPAPAFEGTP